MYPNYNSYYPNNMYNYNQQPINTQINQPMQRQLDYSQYNNQNYRQVGLQGKSVDSIDVVKRNGYSIRRKCKLFSLN